MVQWVDVWLKVFSGNCSVSIRQHCQSANASFLLAQDCGEVLHNTPEVLEAPEAVGFQAGLAACTWVVFSEHWYWVIVLRERELWSFFVLQETPGVAVLIVLCPFAHSLRILVDLRSRVG